MNREAKLRILADAAKYDASCSSSGGKRSRPNGGIGNAEGAGICHSYTPDGRCVSLLKILLTNYCIYDCLFCVNRISSDTPRARFSVNDVVDLTLDFYRRNYIEGLFLSSGIIQSPDYTMEHLVAVAQKLRIEHRFGGYIHLKTIPNCSKELLAAAGRFADRLSMNIELPVQKDLDLLAPAKKHVVIESAMGTIRDLRAETIAARREKNSSRAKPEAFAPAGQSTQMIVGASKSSDQQILETSSKLYQTHSLRRVYYSAFSPIPHSAPGIPALPAPLIREHRLYQADWLLRFYGYSHSELFTKEEANLSLEIDPKFAWAIRHPQFFPVDVNKASKAQLLRVPGFGVRSVQRILKARLVSALRIDDITRLRVPFERVKYFITAVDSNPAIRLLDKADFSVRMKKKPEQLDLFSNQKLLIAARKSVLTGEL